MLGGAAKSPPDSLVSSSVYYMYVYMCNSSAFVHSRSTCTCMHSLVPCFLLFCLCSQYYMEVKEG